LAPSFFVFEDKQLKVQKPQRLDLRLRHPAPPLWYLQYSKIAPRLKDLPEHAGGKNSIHFILRLLQGYQKAEGVRPIVVGGAYDSDQTALP